jgi:membrane-associated HD superfamily phosphohydrolase
MKHFLRIGAYVLHPLLMPLLGALVYFVITPRFIDSEIIRAKLFAIAIITLVVPIVLFMLLKNIGWISSLDLPKVKQRKIPLMLQCLLLLLIIKMVFDPYDSPEMYFFFVGVLFSTISALLLVIFKVKVSLHQMGIAGVTMFIIALSVHFKVNMLVWIGLVALANGWVASSRLHTNSHTYPELILGFFVGLIPQFLMLNFWL